MSGWYIMHRGWMDSFKPEPFTEREAFLWSIEQAAFEDHDQWFNGHRVAVRRGEFVTSLRAMADAFGWSVKRVRGLMERLGKAEKWAQRPAYDGAQAPTVISVCNYAHYQQIEKGEGTAKGTAKGTRGAQQGHSKGTQQNKGNKGNKEEDSPSDSSVSKPASPPDLPAEALPAPDDVGEALRQFEAIRVQIEPAARPLRSGADRRQKLASRLAEFGGLTEWAVVLSKIRGSPFLRGETSRWSGCVPIDWVLEPRNLRKILEGNYDERAQRNGHAAHKPVPQSSVDALAEARAAGGFG